MSTIDAKHIKVGDIIVMPQYSVLDSYKIISISKCAGDCKKVNYKKTCNGFTLMYIPSAGDPKDVHICCTWFDRKFEINKQVVNKIMEI